MKGLSLGLAKALQILVKSVNAASSIPSDFAPLVARYNSLLSFCLLLGLVSWKILLYFPLFYSVWLLGKWVGKWRKIPNGNSCHQCVWLVDFKRVELDFFFHLLFVGWVRGLFPLIICLWIFFLLLLNFLGNQTSQKKQGKEKAESDLLSRVSICQTSTVFFEL